MEAICRLNELLFDNELEIKELSSKVGIKLRVLYRYMNNERIPCLKNCIKLSEFFKCSIDYLLGLSNEDNYTDVCSNRTFVEIYEELLRDNKTNNHNVSLSLGIGRNQYYNWKKGISPKIETLITLSKHFHVSIDYLIGKEY